MLVSNQMGGGLLGPRGLASVHRSDDDDAYGELPK
jgi:hypothetical protein